MKCDESALPARPLPALATAAVVGAAAYTTHTLAYVLIHLLYAGAYMCIYIRGV